MAQFIHFGCLPLKGLIQLMRRFLDSKSYIPCNWPSEYREKFLPVLENI